MQTIFFTNNLDFDPSIFNYRKCKAEETGNVKGSCYENDPVLDNCLEAIKYKIKERVQNALKNIYL